MKLNKNIITGIAALAITVLYGTAIAQHHHHEGDVHISVVEGYAVVLDGEYTGPHGEPDIYTPWGSGWITDEPGFELDEETLSKVFIQQVGFTTPEGAVFEGWYGAEQVFGDGGTGILEVTGHQHADFGFSQLGLYSFTFKLMGAEKDGNPIQCADTNYTMAWQVVPEPSALAGIIPAIAGLFFIRRRK